MKRLIKATTAKNVDRITIDFYGGIDLTEIEAASNPKRVFKNTQVVMRDVKLFIESKGLKVLNMKKSINDDSDSTYYDIDVKISDNKGKLKYAYFRISDHNEDPLNEEPRSRYYDRKTRQYEGLSENDEVTEIYVYRSIDVIQKRYDNYDRAMNYVKQLIVEELKNGGVL